MTFTFTAVRRDDPFDVDAVVVFTVPGPDGVALQPGAERVDEAFGGRLAEAVAAVGATGEEGDVARVPSLGALKAPLVVAAGTGGAGSELLRRAAGEAARAAGRCANVAVVVPDSAGAAGAVCEGWRLGGYRFDRYKSAPAGPPDVAVRLAVADPAAVAEEVHRAEVTADAVCLCRDLVATPAADLTPAAFADEALRQAAALDLACDVWDVARLTADGMGGLLGVGKGSVNEPRLVRVAYQPQGASRTVAVVGKGITFDSGGLNMKSGEALASMKADMAGAGAALATVAAAARLRLDTAVVAWLALAENMPGGAAMRPSDVLRSYDGTTIEVLDTDAEGRLVLADALARAGEERPDVIVDVATLTGAHVPAVGTDYAGLVCEHPDLRDALLAAGEAVGEPLWHIPLSTRLRSALDSRIADVRNIGEPGVGRLAVSALFLQRFVPEQISWAHLDIVGPSSNRGAARGYLPTGPSGVGVRLLLAWLRRPHPPVGPTS